MFVEEIPRKDEVFEKKKKCLQLTPQPFILRATAPPAEPRQNGGIIVEYKRASVYSLYFLKASAVELHTHHLNRCSSSFSSFQSMWLYYFSLLPIIFSHFVHPVSAVKWPVLKEQIVCV